MTAGELAVREGIMLAQSRDTAAVVVVGWTGRLDDSDLSFKDLGELWCHLKDIVGILVP